MPAPVPMPKKKKHTNFLKRGHGQKRLQESSSMSACGSRIVERPLRRGKAPLSTCSNTANRMKREGSDVPETSTRTTTKAAKESRRNDPTLETAQGFRTVAM